MTAVALEPPFQRPPSATRTPPPHPQHPTASRQLRTSSPSPDQNKQAVPRYSPRVFQFQKSRNPGLQTNLWNFKNPPPSHLNSEAHPENKSPTAHCFIIILFFPRPPSSWKTSHQSRFKESPPELCNTHKHPPTNLSRGAHSSVLFCELTKIRRRPRQVAARWLRGFRHDAQIAPSRLQRSAHDKNGLKVAEELCRPSTLSARTSKRLRSFFCDNGGHQKCQLSQNWHAHSRSRETAAGICAKIRRAISSTVTPWQDVRAGKLRRIRCPPPVSILPQRNISEPFENPAAFKRPDSPHTHETVSALSQLPQSRIRKRSTK